MMYYNAPPARREMMRTVIIVWGFSCYFAGVSLGMVDESQDYKVHQQSGLGECYPPPYVNVSLISVHAKDVISLRRLREALENKCGFVRTVDPERGLTVGQNAIVLSPKGRSAIQGVQGLQIKVIERNLATIMERWPKQQRWDELKEGQRSPKQLDKQKSSAIHAMAVQAVEKSLTVLQEGGVDERWYSQYRMWEEIEKRLLGFGVVNSSVGNSSVRVFEVGRSVEDRPIWAVAIGGRNGTAKKRVLLNGLQHAREWVSASVAMYITERLVQLVRSDPESNKTVGKSIDLGIQRMLQRDVEVVVVPLVNPDGYVYTHEVDRLWRKNRRKFPGDQRCEGVDLNRNWGTDWAGPQSTEPIRKCSDLYIGRSAFSEPETTAIKNLVESKGGWKAHIDLHSFGQLILGPWAHSDEEPPRVREVDGFGSGLKKAIEGVNGEIYRYGRGESGLLYLASGVAPDWSFSKGIMAVTIELRPSHSLFGGFELPARDILPTAREAYSGVEFLIRYANDTSIALEIEPVPEQDEDIRLPSRGLRPSSITLIATISSLGLVILALVFLGVWYIVKRHGRGPDDSIENQGPEENVYTDPSTPATHTSTLGRPGGVPTSPRGSDRIGGRFANTPRSPRSPRSPRTQGAVGFPSNVASAVAAARSASHESSSQFRTNRG